MDNDIVKSHQSTKSTINATENKLILNVNESVSGSKFFENGMRSEWCSTKDASRVLSITENAIRIMVHREQIPFYKFGRRLRFKYSDLEALFKKGEFKWL